MAQVRDDTGDVTAAGRIATLKEGRSDHTEAWRGGLKLDDRNRRRDSGEKRSADAPEAFCPDGPPPAGAATGRLAEEELD